MTPERPVSRRQVLRALAGGAAGLVSTGLIGACAPSATPSASPRPSLAPSASPGSGSTSPPATTPTPGPSPSLTLRQRIASLLIVGFRGRHIDDSDAAWVRRAIRADGLGGVILFDRDLQTGGARNVESPEQVARLARDLHDLAPGRRVIVSIDQEGGVVSRLSPAYGFPVLASEAAVGGRGDAKLGDWAAGLVTTLAEAGIDLNLAPVVDLNLNPSNPAIGALGRAFSADPAIVAHDAAIEIRAHRDRAIRTSLKHFPGLGSATVNTDFGIADVTTTWRASELQPYRALLSEDLVDAIMVGHVVNGQIDPGTPASLSRATVTDLLRGELGWDGVVLTDDLQAAAITEQFGLDDAIGLALEAGSDVLLLANQQVYDPDVVTHVVDRVEALVTSGRLSEEQIDQSLARLSRLIERSG